jgi:hypothetical protein
MSQRFVGLNLKGKIEHLNFFLHCWYSVSRGRRALARNHNWYFRTTRFNRRRNNNMAKALPPVGISLHWSKAPFPA